MLGLFYEIVAVIFFAFEISVLRFERSIISHVATLFIVVIKMISKVLIVITVIKVVYFSYEDSDVF